MRWYAYRILTTNGVTRQLESYNYTSKKNNGVSDNAIADACLLGVAPALRRIE